jgi:hypothetical protein
VSRIASTDGLAACTTLSTGAALDVGPTDARAGARTNAFQSAADANSTTSVETSTSMRRSNMRAICERTASGR